MYPPAPFFLLVSSPTFSLRSPPWPILPRFPLFSWFRLLLFSIDPGACVGFVGTFGSFGVVGSVGSFGWLRSSLPFLSLLSFL